MKHSGIIVDVLAKEMYEGTLVTKADTIVEIIREPVKGKKQYIIPGFIDSHIHIESTMVAPQYFADHVKQFGTIGVVSDPHEISNVCGVDGFEFMYNDAKKSDIAIFFGVPSCVPATQFETSGAEFDTKTISHIFDNQNIVCLSEMMNFPGVIYNNKDVNDKINIAKSNSLPIDGHAPGLRGNDLKKYINAGISTDHEAYSFEEAEEKIKLGMKIQIREGSAAQNFNALHNLIDLYPDKVMFCTDDSHPDTLINGHINKIVVNAIKHNHDIFNVLQASSINAINHYNLPIGKLQLNDYADFIIVDNLKQFNIIETWLRGNKIYSNIEAIQKFRYINPINNFKLHTYNKDLLQVKDLNKPINIIQAINKELITKKLVAKLPSKNGFVSTNLKNDILKIVVLNRYVETPEPQVGFIKGFGLNRGAIASSVAHDSHNVIAIGVDDESICIAIDEIIKNKGGICVYDGKDVNSIGLPIGGLMAIEQIPEMARKYKFLDDIVKKLGSKLDAPFMTLAFMSLLVIPELKLGDKGLFDVNKFEFINLYE